MDCFDPYRDYFELSFLRPDTIESENGSKDWHKNGKTSNIADTIESENGSKDWHKNDKTSNIAPECVGWMNGTEDMHKHDKTSNIAPGYLGWVVGTEDMHKHDKTSNIAPECVGWMNGTEDMHKHDKTSNIAPEDLGWMNSTKDMHKHGKTSNNAPGYLGWMNGTEDMHKHDKTSNLAPGYLGWMNGTLDWPISDGSDQSTPWPSWGESNDTRPLLGRLDSTQYLLDHTDLKTHFSSSQQVSDGLDSVSTAVLSDVAGGAWGHEGGAWVDINSEIQRSQTSAQKRNRQRVGRNNGLYSSPGFSPNSDTSQDRAYVSRSASQTPNESLTVAPSYPYYYAGCKLVQIPIEQLAFLLNRYMQQGSQSFAKNGFYNFNSLEEGKFCVFCKKNGEREQYYVTHVIKDSMGKVICPVLRKYTCPICGASGDYAHTLRHCPIRDF